MEGLYQNVYILIEKKSFDFQSQPIPYKYGYDIVGGDHHSGDFKHTRQESGDGHGNVQGSYSYQDALGNRRVVNYVADHHGFRAQVRTNEPGKNTDIYQ